MAAVGVTSPAAPATVSAAVCSSSTRRRVHLVPTRFFAAASFRRRCAAAADGGAAASEDLAAAADGYPDAGTDVAGGAATSTRPPYSLISAANVQKAMRGLGARFLFDLYAITDADHYGRLGITRLASTDEVKAAYEKRCEQLNKQGLEEEEISKEHDLLKESFTILSTEEERRLYDWSLERNGQPE
ncbi:hypothetical protein CFC21_070653 [Triticum aestivum]|uniref:J domain-containing protein n=2 Tax=Triticum aestivum TaxID=4565 RepID=A0A9R1HF58_WHEAT|nr:hypothetical protein CFC21_070653 [Triticum aestivum]